ncbi:hypothetical protein BH11MYX2_BH11MYX2_25300 [soil metagenome]
MHSKSKVLIAGYALGVITNSMLAVTSRNPVAARSAAADSSVSADGKILVVSSARPGSTSNGTKSDNRDRQDKLPICLDEGFGTGAGDGS